MDQPESDNAKEIKSENGSVEKPEENASHPAPVENLDALKEVNTEVTSKQKRKPASHPPTSKMVVDSINRLKLRNGASAEAICKDIEGSYEIDMKRVKPLVNQYLKRSVEKGTLVQVSGDGTTGRFKINKSEKPKKVKQELPDKKRKLDATEKSGKPTEKKKKVATHPPAAEMIAESIKRLKLRNGAPAEAIYKDIEGVYKIEMKKIKPLVNRYLKQGVEKGMLVQVSGDGVKGRFKVNKTENARKAKQNNPDVKKKTGPVMKVDVPKKKVQ